MKTAGHSSRFNFKTALRRLALGGLILLASLYVLGAIGGYLFLRYGRKIEQVRITDVALLRFAAVRRTFAEQHFREAKVAADAKDYQQAYVLYTSAVARDPDNREGRLAAARFFAALGATNLEINLLEDGLERAPADRKLTEMLFGRLLSNGRQRHALELLHGSLAAALTGPNAPFLQTVELQATFVTSGAPAAKALLGRRPELRQLPMAVPVVAQVLWESGEKSEAIALLAAQVEANPDALPAYLVLADWQRQAGREQPAIDTAVKAVTRFPQEPAARVLLLDVGAERIRGKPDWWREIGSYLRDFNGSPKAVFVLAELAGRRGWLELSRTLYDFGASRRQDLGMLSLFYSDALALNSRPAEVRAVLAEIEQQSAERNTPFLLQLRQREITAAAAASDREALRDYARRLAALLRNDADALEQYRRHYQEIGLADVVAELSERKPRATPARTGS